MEGWEESAARPKAAAADWIAHLKRGATTIMALQKWGGRGSDDIGAVVLREERCVVVDILPGAGCVVCFVLMCVVSCLSCLDAGRRRMSVILHGC